MEEQVSLTEYRVGDKAIWNAGREYERERIIKLLDDLLVSLNGAYPTDYGLAATLRQLIKGETNE